MLPSALPAFSPPRGVRSAPRRAASCGLTAPHARCANNSPAAATWIVFIAAPSERELDARRDEAAVVEQVVLTGAAKARVGNIQVPGLLQIRANADGGRVPALDKVAARAWRDAVHILRPGGVRQEVPCADEVRVLEPPGDHVAP